jgi:hypothetical protein
VKRVSFLLWRSIRPNSRSAIELMADDPSGILCHLIEARPAG